MVRRFVGPYSTRLKVHRFPYRLAFIYLFFLRFRSTKMPRCSIPPYRPTTHKLNGRSQYLVMDCVVHAQHTGKHIPLALPFLSNAHNTLKWPCSQLCCRLASEGKVVLAVEHRDGTGPAAMPPPSSQSGDKNKTDRPRPKYYIIPEKDVMYVYRCCKSQPF